MAEIGEEREHPKPNLWETLSSTQEFQPQNNNGWNQSEGCGKSLNNDTKWKFDGQDTSSGQKEPASHTRNMFLRCCTSRYVENKEDSYKLKASKRDVFVWKIAGFTSLMEQGAHYTATAFTMQRLTWYLSINPLDWKISDTGENKHVSLLISTYVYPEDMIEAKFKLFIHDQLYGKHVEREVRHTFLKASYQCGVSCMLPLKTLKDASLGFLVNDTIAISVELIQLKVMPCNGLVTSNFTHKNKSSESYQWNIEDFYQLDNPVAFSDPFKIGDYNWRLQLKQGVFTKEHISIYLTLDELQFLPSSGVMVDVVFSIKTLSSGAYKMRCSFNFTARNTSWGYPKFMRIDDFRNPENGYLIKGKCTFEASISIVGCSNNCTS